MAEGLEVERDGHGREPVFIAQRRGGKAAGEVGEAWRHAERT